jgi:molecular chaperone DnaK
MTYGLGVDLGTTFTAAAVSDATGTRSLPLGEHVSVSSVVFAAEDGVLLTGDDAERRAIVQPHHASHAHKRRLGDPSPLVLGGITRTPALLMATQLRDVIAAATAAEGAPPRAVVLTCPAVWGAYRRKHFAEVPRLAGLRDVQITTEPEAAAMHYSVERRLGEGQLIAVYDLGGGTFDATILRARRHGMEVVGTPEGIERMGGIEFDDTLLAFADERLDGRLTTLDRHDPGDIRVLAAARDACEQAKVRLSDEPDAVIRVPLPGTPAITVSRSQFNDLIRPLLELTVEAMTRTITGAGLRPDDLAGVLLAGGSSRVPLVSQIVSDTFGRPVQVGLHPKLTVALGAAAIARTEAARLDRPHSVSAPVTAPLPVRSAPPAPPAQPVRRAAALEPAWHAGPARPLTYVPRPPPAADAATPRPPLAAIRSRMWLLLVVAAVLAITVTAVIAGVR